MATNQTSVVNQKAVEIGSARVEYSEDDGSSYTNLGVGDSFAFTENITPLDARPDNGPAPTALDGVATQSANVTGNMWELDLNKLDALRGGIDTYATVASSLVEDNEQVIASGDWSYNIPINLSGLNQTGLIPTINSVTLGTNGAIVLLTDYVTIKNADGSWAISILDSETVTTEAQSVTIDTDYTPSASSSLSSGGKTAASRVWIRLTNRVVSTADAADAAANDGVALADTIYRKTIYDFYYCKVNTGLAQTFPSKDETVAVVLTPLDMLAEIDVDRTIGDQLFKITKSIELASTVTV